MQTHSKTRKKTRKKHNNTRKATRKTTRKETKPKCIQYADITHFRNYELLHSPWVPYSQHTQFVVKTSNIKNAGDGVFVTKLYKPREWIMNIEGESLEPWYYHAIDTDYPTGIEFTVPRLGKMIWKCVVNTLGCKINCSQSEKLANCEFVVYYSALDHVKKKIDGNKFIQLYAKNEIQKGDELLVYYGKSFWKQKQKNMWCAICLTDDSTKKNPLFLCDGPCHYGYHLQCLQQLGKTIPKVSKKKWKCFNC